jgi:DNA-directed RNA polymerase subunit M/transcription elongation factor TFIIS
LSNFCPECGGELKLDTATKNFICKSCGLFASREKMDELRDKTFRDEGNDRKNIMMTILTGGHLQRKISRECS